MSQTQTSINPLVVAVMGLTDSHKSSFYKYFIGREPPSLGPSECRKYESFELDGQPLTLIDTPEFDNTKNSDTDVLELLSAFLGNGHAVNGKPLAGIIYVHRMAELRIGCVSVRNFEMLDKLCGIKNVVILTHRWNEVSPDIADIRHDILRSPMYFQPALDKGAVILRHSHEPEFAVESAKTILRHIVDNHPITYRQHITELAQFKGQLQARDERIRQLEEENRELRNKPVTNAMSPQQPAPSPQVDLSRERLRIFTEHGKKRLTAHVQVLFTLTPAADDKLYSPQVQHAIAWKILSFQESVPAHRGLSWGDDVGFSVVEQQEDNIVSPGNLCMSVDLKHMTTLRSDAGNTYFSEQRKTSDASIIGVFNKTGVPQHLALCSVDNSKEDPKFYPVIDIGTVKPEQMVTCSPPIMLQAYAVSGYKEGQIIKPGSLRRALFVDPAGDPRPIDIHQLKSAKTFRLYTNFGKVALEET